MSQDQATLDGIQRTEARIQEIEETADPAMRSRMREIIQGLLDFHGAAVARIIEHAVAAGGAKVLDALARDELTASLLLLYDLHPEGLRARVEKALAEVRPMLKGHGGNVQLIDVEDGVVRLRLEGNCHGCPSSTLTMKSTIEQAIVAAAPDAVAIEVDGVEPTNGHKPLAFVPLGSLAMKVGT